MARKGNKSFAAQGEGRLSREALALARANQEPGQTRAQTRAIARGIRKGIAQYKAREKSLARERDRNRKRLQRGATPETEESGVALPESGGTAIWQRVLAGAGAVLLLVLLAALLTDLNRVRHWEELRPVLRSASGIYYPGLLLNIHLDCGSGMLETEFSGRKLTARAAGNAPQLQAQCESAGMEATP